MINTIDVSLSNTATAAERLAVRNFRANLRSLQKSQPTLIDLLHQMPADVEWVFARDGSLSALDSDGQWWRNCSLPKRAAKFMLKKAELDGTLLCFLFPTHAQQLRVALDRALPGQALLALTPDELTARMLLACEDFSTDIDAHRLYIAAGEKWEAALDQLFEEKPGLPTPTQFIRPILADSSPADEMISPAQKIFADHSSRRSERVRTARLGWKSSSLQRICVVAPSLFRLWDDTGTALARALNTMAGEITLCRFNPDDPAAASSAALAALAATCDGVVTPNMARADMPDLIPDEMPWATWLTSPRIPLATSAGPRDTLLIADAEWKTIAVERGWPADKIFVAGWPPAEASVARRPQPGVFQTSPSACLAMITDTADLQPPDRVTEYSSHRMLWETIAHELLANPFSLTGSADNYLAVKMKRAQLGEEGFDRAAFLDGVILHAWQQGIAHLLLAEKLPLKLFGTGWENLEEFQPHAGGPVRSRADLAGIVEASAGLVHAWPIPFAHPIEATGKPVIRIGKRRESVLRDAKLALAGTLELPHRGKEILNADVVRRALSAASRNVAAGA